MIKKCPECSGFGIALKDEKVSDCPNCDGRGLIFVKFQIRRIRGIDGSFIDAQKPWKLEHPDGFFEFFPKHEIALKYALLYVKRTSSLTVM